MKTLAVTGGIGSGKSEVCRYLESVGIPVYNSDIRAKLLYDENPVIVMDIQEALGCDITGPDGKLDRKKLGRIVFSDSNKLSILEGIVHPYVFEDFIRWRNDHFDEAPFNAMESAIMLERPLFRSLCDKVLFVDAPFEKRLERAMLRDSTSEEVVRARMKAQKFDKSKVDAVVMNDSDLKTLFGRVDKILQTIWNEN
ncbi:MAG: dephospho-CoA kinase [Bacteroidales bacterium]|nr:dephospho-CoA kinase [Bacteroidales bacterium]